MVSQNDNETKGSWLEWAKYVLRTLQNHEDAIKEIRAQERLDQLEFEKFRTKIETKTSMLAIILSIIITLAINIIVLLLERFL